MPFPENAAASTPAPAVNPAFHMNRSERIAFPVPVEFGDHVANTEVYKCGVDLAAGLPVSHPAI